MPISFSIGKRWKIKNVRKHTHVQGIVIFFSTLRTFRNDLQTCISKEGNIHKSNIYSKDAFVELKYAFIGLQHASIGLQYAFIGLQHASIVLQYVS
jgi:hypothetical protein